MKLAARLASAIAAVSLVTVAAFGAARLQLAPYKDELFKYPKVLTTGYGGDYVVVEFNQKRDVIDRDDKPDEKTKAEYVSLEVKSVEADLVLESGGVTVKYVGVGKTSGKAAIVVVFIHGWQATRFDGANDWRSGGNLNRIKNLMVRAGGAYLSADYSNDRRTASRQIRALIEAYGVNSPGAPIILACASLGARVCWDVARDPGAAARIDGMIFFAGVADSGFPQTAARDPSKRIPIYLSHGNRDNRVGWRQQERLFKGLKAAVPDYPIKLAVFDTGTHRTPLRMTDWRLVLNWMLSLSR